MLRAEASSYFQCSVDVWLSTDFMLGPLSLDLLASSGTSRVLAETPLDVDGPFSLDAHHGHIDLQQIRAPSVDVKLRDGYLVLDQQLRASRSRLQEYSNNHAHHLNHANGYNQLQNNRKRVKDVFKRRIPVTDQYVSISSGDAALIVRASSLVNVELPREALKRSLFRSDASSVAVSKVGDNMAAVSLYPEEESAIEDDRMKAWNKPLRVRVASVSSPVYVTVQSGNSLETTYATWAGSIQQKKCSLSTASQRRMEEIKKWTEEDESANWQATLRLTGDNLMKGRWDFVSSKSLAFFNPWFALTSAGIMAPRTLKSDVSYTPTVHAST